MKKKPFGKMKAGILTLAMTMGMLSVGIQPVTVQAADTTKTINFGASSLAPSDGTWDAANDHKVYFGQWGGNSTAFRVLKADADTMMLDCDTILIQKKFDEDTWPNTDQAKENIWKNSDLEIWLNGNDYYGNSSVFTSVEKNAIVETAVSADDYFSNSEDYEAEDYVYLLSATEANTLYDSDAARVKTGCEGTWWLRSGLMDGLPRSSRVSNSGAIGACTVDMYRAGASPVFNINLSSVLFTSASGVGKSSDTLAQVTEDSTVREWKLTLSDIGKTVAVASGETVTRSGNTITVPYTYTGSDVSQISVMITSDAYDAAGTEILYYGKLNTALSATGTGTFTLPDGLPDGYRMYIMAEDVNADNYTDYASAPVEIKATETVPDDPNPDVPAPDDPNPDVPAPDDPNPDVPVPDNPNPDAPIPDKPEPDEPNEDAPTSDYTITNGGNGAWTIGEDGSMTITGNGDVSKFVGVKADGNLIDSSNYTAASDATTITLTKSYLDSLSVGVHTFEIVWSDGSAATSFTINEESTDEDDSISDEKDDSVSDKKDKEPETGDDTPISWVFVLLMVSSAGLVFVARKRYMENIDCQGM